jgi:hypothetical protein
MAALNKRWLGTAATVTTGTTTYTTATNWAPINLTRPIYKWTQSAAQANEYRLELLAGGNPGISQPGSIYLNGSLATEAAVGSLAVGQWDYADNDTLGYSTVYVRVTGTVDPDTLDIGYVQMYQVPVATDHVRIAAGSGNITGVDQSSVAVGDFIVEDGYTGTIGSVAMPLIIDPDRFEWSGTGRSYIDLYTANIAPDVIKTGAGGAGLMGLYLTGTNLTTLTVYAGTVGLGWLHGMTSTAVTVRALGTSAAVYVGKNVTLTTGYSSKGGKLYINCAATTINAVGGTLKTEEQGAVTSINVYAGAAVILNSTGTVGTLTLKPGYTGTTDLTQSAESRTYSSIVQHGGTLLVDKGVVTVSAHTTPENIPQKIQVSNL